MMKLLASAGLLTAQGLNANVRNPEYLVSGDHVSAGGHGVLESQPGTPELAEWKGAPVLSRIEAWRVDLAGRLVRAAGAHDAMASCGKFLSFGDYTWCMKAMPRESDPSFRKIYGGISEFVVDGNISAPPTNPDDFVGLSFGIRTSDAWSELMSSMFRVRTDLFDCYFEGTDGPMVQDRHKGYSKEKPCMARGCYTAAYKAHRVCNDDTTANATRFTAGNGKTYEPLHLALHGRPRLSTFVKMDVEGSEWASLERLLRDEGDLAKIRTLDMEIHVGRDATPEGMRKVTRETATRNVEIMEKLAEKFAVTGSSLETYVANVLRGYGEARRRDPKYVDTVHPANVYTKDGVNLDQYTISFVNRALL